LNEAAQEQPSPDPALRRGSRAVRPDPGPAPLDGRLLRQPAPDAENGRWIDRSVCPASPGDGCGPVRAGVSSHMANDSWPEPVGVNPRLDCICKAILGDPARATVLVDSLASVLNPEIRIASVEVSNPELCFFAAKLSERR